VTDFSFALVIGDKYKKGWRSVFCTDTKVLLDRWLTSLKANIFIGTYIQHYYI
jgi:hypothetical protein